MTSVYILASTPPWIPNLPPSFRVPKPLYILYKDHTILDYQMNLYKQNNWTNITIMTGYKQELIKKLCQKRGYNIKLVKEKDWETEKSSAEFYWKNADLLLSSEFPVFVVFGDLLFNQRIITDLLGCGADICRVRSSWQFTKFTKNGLREAIKVSRIVPEENFAQAWWHMVRDEPSGNITTATIWTGWCKDIDDPKEMADVKRNKGWNKP